MADPYATQEAYPPEALPIGTRLGEFEIRRMLGVGGFGIVYQAFDHQLERDVAIKEYMPATLAARDETMHVSLLSDSNSETFALGLRSFVNEAKLLARFDHPSLLKVHRFWEANGTAYMAMALYRGRTLRDVRLELQHEPDEAWVRSLLEPLLGAIEQLHAQDVYHRDIAPDNILVEADGHPVLLDFGAARRVISDRTQNLTAILKPSYAPIEQYADVTGMRQGPWTDIYALGATMHFLLLGKPPLPAPARTIQDHMKPLAEQALPGCSRVFLETLDWMLAPRPENRLQSVQAVRDALAGQITRPAPAADLPIDDLDITQPIKAVRPPPEDEDATIVIPRGQPTRYDTDATLVVPRTPEPGEEDFPPTMFVQRRAEQAPRIQPAQEDATLVNPRTRTMVPPPLRTELPPRAPPAPPPAAPPFVPPIQADEDQTRSRIILGVAIIGVAIVVGAVAVWMWPREISVPRQEAKPQVVAPQPTAQTPPPSVPAVDPAAGALPTTANPPQVASPAPVIQEAPPATPPPVVSPSPQRPPVAAAPRQVARPAPSKPSPAGPDPLAEALRTTPPPAPARPQPEPAAAAPAQPAVQSPSDRCRDQLPLVRLVCIDIQCGKAELANHPECLKLRQEQERVRNAPYTN